MFVVRKNRLEAIVCGTARIIGNPGFEADGNGGGWSIWKVFSRRKEEGVGEGVLDNWV